MRNSTNSIPRPFYKVNTIGTNMIGSTFAPLLFWVFGAVTGHAQILEPATWDCSVKAMEGGTSKGITVGDIVSLSFKVDLEEGWYIYSPDQEPGLGPILTSLRFEESDYYVPTGNPTPFSVIEKYDNVWDAKVRIINEDGGGFEQRIKVLKPNPIIRGTIIHTVCSETTGQCIFPQEDFEIKIKTSGKK